jgi:hypothetical protein
MITVACQDKEDSLLKQEQNLDFDKIVCSRGPIYPANIEITSKGDYSHSGELFGEEEVEYGMFEHYFVGKMKRADLLYVQQLINRLEKENNNDEPAMLDVPLYYMRVYEGNCYKEFKGQIHEVWAELFEFYKKLKLKRVRGRRLFETTPFVLPPLPDLSNQPEIQEIED